MAAPTTSVTRDLTSDATGHRYLFTELSLPAGSTTPFRRHDDDLRTHIVIGGSVAVESVGADGAVTATVHRAFTGWHAPPGSVYRLANRGEEQALVIEAGTRAGSLREGDTHTALLSTGAPAPACRDADGYTVDKPWGHEVWYTANLDDPPYAVKQIHMVAGHQSSLQSHRFKAETNYVVEGEAKVLNGLRAPEDLSAIIDVAGIPVTLHGPRTGWSSPPNVLHRVIAQRTYTSIEVSTSELDDVIRWQDDTGRGHGRVEGEHRGSR
ncbi:hypothetical protein ACFV5N_03680 [Streptomyces sp. NPDC059853]|uniref:hypothetical protein n=1 Tax=Streptomyces sp. NPDC059853 TaxID=3346973 RepID=UPI00365ED566